MRLSGTHRPRYPAWLANLGMVLASTALVLGLAEAVLRRTDDAALPNGTRPAQMDIARNALVNPVSSEEESAFRWDGKGDGLLHVRSQNRRMVYELRPGAHPNELISINADGFRDKPFSRVKSPGTFRIAVIGDSISFGWYQRLDQTYPKVLEALLNAHAAPGTVFEVYNFGIGGYNAEQEVALIEDRVFRYRPDLLLVQYCSNDGEIGADNGLYAHFTRGQTRLGDLLHKVWLRWRGRDRGRHVLESSYRELSLCVKNRGIPALVLGVPYNCGAEDLVSEDLAIIQGLGLNLLALSNAYRAFPREQLFQDCYHPNNMGCRIAAEEILGRLCSDRSLGAADRMLRPLPDFEAARRDLGAGFADLQDGKPDAALEAYGRAVAAVPAYGQYAANSVKMAALDLSAKGNNEAALRLVRFAVDWDPGRPEHHLEMARFLIKLGRQDEALQSLRESISLWREQPDSVAPGATPAHAYCEMGRLLQNDPEQQVEAFRNALRQKGLLEDAFEGLERHYRDRADPAGCVAEFHRFVEERPDCLLGKFYLARALVGVGELEGAERVMAAALKQDPQNRKILLAQAGLAVRREKCAQAGEALLAVIRQNPDDYETYRQLLAIDMPCAASQDISSTWAAVAQCFPDKALAQCFLGQFYMGRGRWPEAHQAFARALAQQPNDPGIQDFECRTFLAEAKELETGGKLEEALGLARKASQACPKSGDARCAIAGLLGRLGDLDGAKRVCRERITEDPSDGGASGQLSNLYMAAENWPGLRREWEALAPVAPDQAQGWFYLALACAHMTDWKAARDAAEKAVALNAQDAGACDLLADICVQQARSLLDTGQEAACAVLIDRALHLKGDHPEVLLSSACLAERRGDIDGARELYRSVIASNTENLTPYVLLSKTYDEGSNIKNLIAEWQFMVCSCPGNYLVHYSLGLALDRAGDLAAAREACRTALTLRPDAADFLRLPSDIKVN